MGFVYGEEKDMEYIENIIKNVLIAIYQFLGASLLVSILFMFLYMYADIHGWKKSFVLWIQRFKKEKEFRNIFWLCLYTSMILFKTVLTRGIWGNPLSNVIGYWGLQENKGVLVTENIENTILFIPFTILVLVVFLKEEVNDKGKISLFKIIKITVEVAFTFSLIIEMAQVLLKVGTFQLSDLFFNTIGGFIGGTIYFCVSQIRKK